MRERPECAMMKSESINVQSYADSSGRPMATEEVRTDWYQQCPGEGRRRIHSTHDSRPRDPHAADSIFGEFDNDIRVFGGMPDFFAEFFGIPRGSQTSGHLFPLPLPAPRAPPYVPQTRQSSQEAQLAAGKSGQRAEDVPHLARQNLGKGVYL
jgi:hypothetical protein